jgi:vacuolar-type H+-ATPase subunit C/Vma6
MAASGELAYVYAKACGIHSKSFVGRNVRTITGAASMPELFRRLFPDRDANLPGKSLVDELQKSFDAKQISDCSRILRSFSTPPPILVHYLRAFEVLNVKTILRAVLDEERELPALRDIGRWATIRPERYPDLEAMLSGTAYSWLSAGLGTETIHDIEYGLDLRYYRELLERARGIGGKGGRAVASLVELEIILRNITWALRLRIYYGMEREAVASLLIGEEFSLTGPALAQFDFPLDSFASWEKWNYAFLVSPGAAGKGPWRIDPRDVENRASRFLYRKTSSQFHRFPFTLNTAACFFKLKEFEAGIVRSVSEGIQLSMNEGEIREYLGEA